MGPAQSKWMDTFLCQPIKPMLGPHGHVGWDLQCECICNLSGVESDTELEKIYMQILPVNKSAFKGFL